MHQLLQQDSKIVNIRFSRRLRQQQSCLCRCVHLGLSSCAECRESAAACNAWEDNDHLSAIHDEVQGTSVSSVPPLSAYWVSLTVHDKSEAEGGRWIVTMLNSHHFRREL